MYMMGSLVVTNPQIIITRLQVYLVLASLSSLFVCMFIIFRTVQQLLLGRSSDEPSACLAPNTVVTTW